MLENLIAAIKEAYIGHSFIPLQAPVFQGNEKEYLCQCIDTTFVSSVGEFVDRFEKHVADLTGAKHAIATVNGTSALHMALYAVGVKANDEVITQPLTFVASCNAISYLNAYPVFVDVDSISMGMSYASLKDFLVQHTEQKQGYCYNKDTGRKISACLPMHTYGHPCDIENIAALCEEHNIVLVEDSAQSLGSFYKNKHTGTYGKVGTFSFNGNKIVTSGGGGAIITNDSELAKKIKHLTTTAKKSHTWRFDHDELGYNYRMPNINAALACAQLENFASILKKKRDLAEYYINFCSENSLHFMKEPDHSQSNYWLNTVKLNNREERDRFLEKTNNNNIQTRPAWTLLCELPMYKNAQRCDLTNAQELTDTLVNIPSTISHEKNLANKN